MNDLLILRHGPTPWNRQRRIQGHSDVALDQAGRKAVLNWSIPTPFRGYRCVASPLLRAMETARLLGLDPQPQALLMEMSWGHWEGRTLADLRRELGAKMSQNEAQGLDFRPLGGESPRDVQDRLKAWLPTIERPTLAVAHQGVIRALYALASGWDMRAKAPVTLDKFAAHLFSIDERARVKVLQLNIDVGADA